MKLNNDSGNCSRLNHTQRLRGNIYRFLLTFYPFLQKSSEASKSIGFLAPPLRFQHERTHFLERAYGISLKRTMSSLYPKPRKRRTKNRKGIFPSLPKRTGSFIYLWTFSAIIFDSISFFSSSNPFLRE